MGQYHFVLDSLGLGLGRHDLLLFLNHFLLDLLNLQLLAFVGGFHQSHKFGGVLALSPCVLFALVELVDVDFEGNAHILFGIHVEQFIKCRVYVHFGLVRSGSPPHLFLFNC